MASRLFSCVVFVVGLLSLAACGGGGSNSNSGQTTTSMDDVQPDPVSVELTSINVFALFSNSFGYYEKNADGVPELGQVIWANVKETPIGDVFIIDPGVAEENLGFFLIPDCSANTGLEDGDNVTFQEVDGLLTIFKDGEPLGSIFNNPIFGFAPVFYSDVAFNSDGVDHRILEGGGEERWEDGIDGGDGSYDDVVITVSR